MACGSTTDSDSRVAVGALEKDVPSPEAFESPGRRRRRDRVLFLAVLLFGVWPPGGRPRRPGASGPPARGRPRPARTAPGSGPAGPARAVRPRDAGRGLFRAGRDPRAAGPPRGGRRAAPGSRPAGPPPPRGPVEPGPGLLAAREGRAGPSRSSAASSSWTRVERGGADGPRPRGDGEGKLQGDRWSWPSRPWPRSSSLPTDCSSWPPTS